MIKNTCFILLALFIDGLQAGISWSLAFIMANPLTAGGAATACLAGSRVAGELGCLIGGSVGGGITWLLTTFTPIGLLANSVVAGYTLPVGIALGFAINITLSIVGGAFLVTFMWFFGIKPSLKRLAWSGGEMIPGLNNIPFWTVFVISSLISPKFSIWKGARTLTKGVMGTKEAAVSLVDREKGFEQKLTLPYAKRAKEDQDWEGDILEAQANSAHALGDAQKSAALQRTRQVLQDIRPIRTALSILLIFTLGTSIVHAQTLGDTSSMRLIASPEVPGPNTQVRLEVQGVGNFVGDATITWQENGTTVKSGVGERTHTLTTGGLGSVMRVRVTIESASLGVLTREVVFAPAQVYLVWETNTSVPPFYRGKALYSAGSQITVTAFPQVVVNGSTLSPNNLSFQWQRNGSAVAAQSGSGRNTLTFAGDQLKSGEGVAVDVYFGDVLVAQSSIFIPATNPQILLYQRDPLRGVLFDQALPEAISLTGREITLQAVPYFFANESLSNGSLAYAWTLNSRPTSGPDAASGILTLRQSGEGGGEARLGVSLQNTDTSKLLQAAEAMLRIVFGTQSSGSSLFGI